MKEFLLLISTVLFINISLVAQEKSVDARGHIENVKVIGSNDEATILDVKGKNNLSWLIMISNKEDNPSKKHNIKFDGKAYNWTGNFEVIVN